MTSIPRPHRPFVRAFFFWAGIVATLCYRAIILLNGVSGRWLDVVWYAGTFGFILYFAHRYQIAERRSHVIRKLDLLNKVSSATGLQADDRAALAYVLASVQTSKERWNYIVIFTTSALALIANVLVDILRA